MQLRSFIAVGGPARTAATPMFTTNVTPARANARAAHAVFTVASVTMGGAQ